MEIKTASGFQANTTAVPVSEEATLLKFVHSQGGKSELKCDLRLTFGVDFLATTATNRLVQKRAAVGKIGMPSIKAPLRGRKKKSLTCSDKIKNETKLSLPPHTECISPSISE